MVNQEMVQQGITGQQINNYTKGKDLWITLFSQRPVL